MTHTTWHRWSAPAVDLLLPRECAWCGDPAVAFCAACAVELSRQPVTEVVPGVMARVDAVGIGRAVVRAHKDGPQRSLAAVLGALLAESVAHLLIDREVAGERWPIVLVPVPTRASARRRRGMNPAHEIARHAARHLPSTEVAAALRLRRQPVDQRRLGAAERVGNLGGAMFANAHSPALRQGLVVVVDDVVTTGATLAEAVRALVAAGCPPVGASAVVATPPHPLGGVGQIR